MLHSTRLGEAAMPLSRQLLKRILDSGSGSIRAVAVDSQLESQFISGFEADSPDVVCQLIGIFFNFGNGLMPIGAVNSHRPPRRDAVFSQEEHDFADFLLLFPA